MNEKKVRDAIADVVEKRLFGNAALPVRQPIPLDLPFLQDIILAALKAAMKQGEQCVARDGCSAE